jgi:F-type H+-transporting ATPase subunit b
MANPAASNEAAVAAQPASAVSAPAGKLQEAEKALDMLEDDAVPVTHAGTEAAHGGAEEHATPSALGFDATMLVALAMLVVILLALWKKVPAMIAGALDGQIAGIKQLDQATALRAEAENIKSEYEAKAKQAIVDADAMKASAEAEAKLIVARAKTDATALIERRAKAAEEKIAAAERAAIADVRNKAASAAAAAAAQLIAAHHDAKADAALIDQSIASLN